jgi:hypothetical protein
VRNEMFLVWVIVGVICLGAITATVMLQERPVQPFAVKCQRRHVTEPYEGYGGTEKPKDCGHDETCWPGECEQ